MSTLAEFKAREVERVRKMIETESYEVDGVLYWKSNDAVVPPFTYKDAELPVNEKQQAAYDAANEAFFAEYAKRDHTPTDEELFEMRAAFGEGETVVNVITGEKVVL